MYDDDIYAGNLVVIKNIKINHPKRTELLKKIFGSIPFFSDSRLSVKHFHPFETWPLNFDLAFQQFY